ncbi:UNVERIFIED_ORG: hypothetical protein J2791_000553 [Burkholderia contaminans]|nr:hypothetical protein [Burkholderia contaminans]
MKHRHLTLLDARPDAGPGSRDAFPAPQALALAHALQPR